MHKGNISPVFTRIIEIEDELRKYALLYGVTVKIETCLSEAPSNQGKAASETTLYNREKKYKHDHYYDGRDELHDGRFRTIKPEEIRIRKKADVCDKNCFKCVFEDCMRDIF